MDDGLRSTVISYAAPEDSLPKQAMIRLIEGLSARRRIVRAYEEARRTRRPNDNIWALAVRSLDITVRYSADKLAAVPKEGPLVVVATIRLAWSTAWSSATSLRACARISRSWR
jgi:hypothetical protein